ncbi:MAG: hypothetical protein ACHQWU_07815, partial [Gemmatimonadales bacterium]
MIRLARCGRPGIGRATLLAASLAAAGAGVAGCSRSRGANAGAKPPRTEFLLSTADSTFWVKTGRGDMQLRAAPLM